MSEWLEADFEYLRIPTTVGVYLVGELRPGPQRLNDRLVFRQKCQGMLESYGWKLL